MRLIISIDEKLPQNWDQVGALLQDCCSFVQDYNGLKLTSIKTIVC
jgi:hypothetical protein